MTISYQDVFHRHFDNPRYSLYFDDAYSQLNSDIVVTTDGYTGDSVSFPGGDVGSMMVHGTVNDLAIRGAKPLFLSINSFIEDGIPIDSLERIVHSLSVTAQYCDIRVVSGDINVVRSRGAAGNGLHFATTGIGSRLPGPVLSARRIDSGDALIISGSIGSHGVATTLASQGISTFGKVSSDCTSIFPLVCALLELPGLRMLSEPTRGGVARSCVSLARASRLGIRLKERWTPIRADVRRICDVMGYDSFHMSSNGRLLAVVEGGQADQALTILKTMPNGEQAAIIGYFDAHAHGVAVETVHGECRDLTAVRAAAPMMVC